MINIKIFAYVSIVLILTLTQNSFSENVYFKGDSLKSEFYEKMMNKRTIERNALSKGKGIIFRLGPDILGIKTQSNDTLYFVDDYPKSSSIYTGDTYTILDFISDCKIAVLQRYQIENIKTILVSTETGETYENLEGVPEFNRNRNSFFTVSRCEFGIAGSCIGMTIWEKDGKSIKKVFKTTTCFDAKWVTDSQIAIIKKSWKSSDSVPNPIIHDTISKVLGRWIHETDGIITDSCTNNRIRSTEEKEFKPLLRRNFPGDEISYLIAKYSNLLYHPNQYVRKCAIEGLGYIDDPRATDLLDSLSINGLKNEASGDGFDFIGQSTNILNCIILEKIFRTVNTPSDSIPDSVVVENIQKLFEKHDNDEFPWDEDDIWSREPLEWNFVPLNLHTIISVYNDKELYSSYTNLETVFLNRKVFPTLIKSLNLEDSRNTAEKLLIKLPRLTETVDLHNFILLNQILVGQNDSARASAMRIISNANKYSDITLSRSQLFLVVRSCLSSNNRPLKIWALSLLQKEYHSNTWNFRLLFEPALNDNDPEIARIALSLLQNKSQEH